MCEYKFRDYPNVKRHEKYRVIEIEYCNYTCKDFIKDISKLSTIKMEKYLDIFFFQIIYTIIVTKKRYPVFSHNDLFMRNILGTIEKDNGNYYTYNINNKNFYVPQKKFFPKINDFGLTNLDEKYHNKKLFKSTVKDIYNILYDVYNGGNLGAQSLSELCKEDADKLKFLKMYFENYFDVATVDEYVLNSKHKMDWDWDNSLDKEFLESIKMKDPDDLLNNYFYDVFGKINKNIASFKSSKK